VTGSHDLPSLFGDSPADRCMERVAPAPVPSAVRGIAARVPGFLRLGTSSWAYPGWRGIVYSPRAPAAALAADGLAAYAAWPLHRTVGLDRAFYATPTECEYRRMAALVPEDFRFTVKADQAVTRPDMRADGSTFGDTGALRASGAANPRFLDRARFVHEVLAPAATGLGARLGPVLLQFPALDLSRGGRLGGAEAFVDRLGGFLAGVRSAARAPGTADAVPTIAVEVRNRELFRGGLVRRYADALRSGGCVHSFLQHPAAPSVTAQWAALDAAGGVPDGPVLVRWMLRAGTGYEAAARAFEPFDRMQAPDETVRDEVVALLASCGATRPGFVIINNKAEGSAVRSVEALAERLAVGRTG